MRSDQSTRKGHTTLTLTTLLLKLQDSAVKYGKSKSIRRESAVKPLTLIKKRKNTTRKKKAKTLIKLRTKRKKLNKNSKSSQLPKSRNTPVRKTAMMLS